MGEAVRLQQGVCRRGSTKDPYIRTRGRETWKSATGTTLPCSWRSVRLVCQQLRDWNPVALFMPDALLGADGVKLPTSTFVTHQIASINTILLLACCAIAGHETAAENTVGLVPRFPTPGFVELVCCSCGNTWKAPSDVEAQEAQGPAAKRSVCKGKQKRAIALTVETNTSQHAQNRAFNE